MNSELSNRLIKEKSPYLLQHARNPVDWYPWSDEAFRKAKEEDRPVILSIGYSTCHWCHVMERESFENPEIADIMNKYFISIKVDREERPDIDHVYMAAVMAMTGSGGWPLTVFLTPDQKPFYGGTYFPPVARWGTAGFKDILLSIAHSWQNRRDQLLMSAQQLTEILQNLSPTAPQDETLSTKAIKDAYDELVRDYDGTYGGFGRAPKFPMGHVLSFLLRYYKRFGDRQALSMVEKTLKEMSRGGIYDHLGGGFHRYATDQKWRVPHFEKMLYDQAMLARAYLEAYQMTHEEHYAVVARETLDYVLSEMTLPRAGFFCGEDADSLAPEDVPENPTTDFHPEKKEGAFYLWSWEEVRALFSPNEMKIFSYHYGFEQNGNIEYDPHGELSGKNILHQAHTLEETAKMSGRSPLEVDTILRGARSKLFSVRQRRPRPHLDDKILTDWNGLMIATLAFASGVLGERRYRDAASQAADFIVQNMFKKDGHLLHRYRQKDSAIMGTLADYAFLAYGLLELYEATFEVKYLNDAKRLCQVMTQLFWDDKGKGFFLTASDAEVLITRQKESYDGAIPSGNAIAALTLIRLAHFGVEGDWARYADEMFKGFFTDVSRRPSAYAQMLIALDAAIGPFQEIVIAVKSLNPSVRDMLKDIYERFLPNKVVLMNEISALDHPHLLELIDFIHSQPPLHRKTTVYVCENHTCRLPVTQREELQSLLDNKPLPPRRMTPRTRHRVLLAILSLLLFVVGYGIVVTGQWQKIPTLKRFVDYFISAVDRALKPVEPQKPPTPSLESKFDPDALRDQQRIMAEDAKRKTQDLMQLRKDRE